MWAAGVFEPTIHYVRFPRFKNFAENMRIDFTHPITALVGPNGSSKTTILRVLQAAPGGRDLGNYWFGTAVDLIRPEDRHRFIYGRHSESQGCDVEVIKTRIARKDEATNTINPDLFEPSRPLTGPPDRMEKYELGGNPPSDGLTTRWKALTKRVAYIDFRTQISAFDWAFHQAEAESADGSETETQLLRKRKARIRRRSHRLNVAIAEELGSDIWNRKERIISKVQEVKDGERRWIEKILSRDYDSIRLIRHRYFRRDGGVTVLMRFADTQYSEAFAGSGEFATVKLVVTVMRAREKSLILLDEPEVSLHPAAQRKAMEFLCHMAKTRKHQFVLATHAPDIIRELPPDAVKVLEIRPDNSQVDVAAQRAAPELAFEAVGAYYDHPTVVVEDELAAAIVNRAISKESFAHVVKVRAIPGGANTLLTYRIPMWAVDSTSNILLLLDGDMYAEKPPHEASISQDDLELEVRNAFDNALPQLSHSASEAVSSTAREEELRRCLEWRRKYVEFLPFDKPEAYVWPRRVNQDDISTGDPKQDWVVYTRKELNSDQPKSVEILTLQRQAVMQIPYDDAAFIKIRSIIGSFVTAD